MQCTRSKELAKGCLVCVFVRSCVCVSVCAWLRVCVCVFVHAFGGGGGEGLQLITSLWTSNYKD